MEYIGIDPSLTGTAIVVLDDESKLLEEKLLSTKSSECIEQRILFIVININAILYKYPDRKIAMEGLSYGSTGSSALELAGLHYYMRCKLYEIQADYEIVPPTVLKKFITGKGNSKKDVMLKEAFKRFGADYNDDNLCDAFCLAKYAMNIKS